MEEKMVKFNKIELVRQGFGEYLTSSKKRLESLGNQGFMIYKVCEDAGGLVFVLVK